MAVYKDNEFRAFIDTIEAGQQGHWIDIAQALSVDKNTITEWKKTPEAQEALRKGINHALQCMQQAGSRDWRMWETKLKMMGIVTKPNISVELQTDPREAILDKYGL